LPLPKLETKDVPGGQIEGACGLAVSGSVIYVSDYYHHSIDVFDLNGGGYLSHLAGNPFDGPCALATAAGGALYATDWHGTVSRLQPSYLAFGPAKSTSTGIAVDPASGNVYVDERTHVAVYEPSGAAVLDGEGDPLLIGSGTLGDAYGVAVFGGKVYVPDAADATVKVYEPAVDRVDPVRVVDGNATPRGGFSSLVDGTVAIDPTNEHMLVVDNLQPGFEHPEAAIYEFGPGGDFLGRLGAKVIDAEPSGLAFADGRLYVSSGNDEDGNVLAFGPYVAASPLAALVPSPSAGAPPAAGERAASLDPGAPRAIRSGPLASSSEVVQRGSVRVSFDGDLTPHLLPRRGAAPVRVAVDARIASTDGSTPPQLRQMAIAINRYGHLSPQGLPLCPLREIQPSTTANALAACRAALVGEGRFSAKVLLGQQAPFPADGKVYAFNGRWHGKPAIFAHVYGTDPVPTSFTLPFTIEPSKGTFGTTLRAALPGVTGSSGYITGLSLSLGRSYVYRGRRRSYLRASCPAPSGFHGAVFPFARASFGFQGGLTLSPTVTRSCGVRRRIR
jgi:DNA-binding beta-propeller fold protein YncE